VVVVGGAVVVVVGGSVVVVGGAVVVVDVVVDVVVEVVVVFAFEDEQAAVTRVSATRAAMVERNCMAAEQ
jgi:hypothetical protein